MAKIVIIAPAEADDDVKDAVKMLKAAGHDVDTEEPSPKSLLHIVLGLFGPNAYGFGPGYAYLPGDGAGPPPKGDDDTKPPKDEPPAKDDDSDSGDDLPPADAGGDDDFNFESLGTVTVDGQLIEAVTHNSDTSVLCVESLEAGAKTTYSLNENIFSFFPADVAKPSLRVEVVVDKHSTSIEVPVIAAEGKATLKVGKDLRGMFEAMGMSDEVAAKKIFDKIKGTPNLKTSHVKDLVKRYLDMVGKAESDITHLSALVLSQLQDADLV